GPAGRHRPPAVADAWSAENGLVVFGRCGSRRRSRDVGEATNPGAASWPRHAACREKRAGDDGGGARRWRAGCGARRHTLLGGADGLLFVVLPDEAAVSARLQRNGDVVADGQERGEQETSKLHPPIVPGASAAPAARLLGGETITDASFREQ